MCFTPEQKRQIEDMVNDATIDHNLGIKREREELGGKERQNIPVEDDVLLSIILPAWSQDVLETGFQIRWQQALTQKTGNSCFSGFSEEQIKPYAVRAGILLETTPEYLERMSAQKKSHSYFQVGSEVAGYIGGVLNKGSGMD